MKTAITLLLCLSIASICYAQGQTSRQRLLSIKTFPTIQAEPTCMADIEQGAETIQMLQSKKIEEPGRPTPPALHPCSYHRKAKALPNLDQKHRKITLWHLKKFGKSVYFR